VTFTTELDSERANEVLTAIFDVSVATPELTPRSRETLVDALADGRLVMAFVDGELAGWGLREPLGRNLVELGLTYTKPQFRSEPVLRGVAELLVAPGNSCVLATYEPRIIAYMVRRFGFRQCTLGEIVRRSRGRFLFKRFDRASRAAIRSRLKHRTPHYAILD
jgi:hypothetical protein